MIVDDMIVDDNIMIGCLLYIIQWSLMIVMIVNDMISTYWSYDPKIW